MTPAGLRGVVNDAVAVHFLDATLAAAFMSPGAPGPTAEMNLIAAADGAAMVYLQDLPTGCLLLSPAML
jgi:hypothetical protein